MTMKKRKKGVRMSLGKIRGVTFYYILERYEHYIINKNRSSDKFMEKFKNKSEKQINAIYSK